MDLNYALIKNNKVINVIVWDGDETKWKPPEDCIVICIEDTLVGVDWTYDPLTNTFIDTRPVLYAVIKNNVVIQKIMWDGNEESWSPPSNCMAVNVDKANYDNNLEINIGTVYDPVTNTFSNN